MSLLITQGLGASQIPTTGTGPALNPTQYMYLTLPVVSVTPGPLYAQDVNGSFLLIDAHDHTPGKGKPVPVTGMNFNGTVLLNGNNLQNANLLTFIIQSPTNAGSVGTLYSSGVDLYFVDGNGTTIQITKTGSINTTGTGGWTGNYGTGGSTASYTTIGTVFALFSTANQYGNLATGAISLYQSNLTSAAPIKLINPLGTTGGYNITLPVLTPAANTNAYPLISLNDGVGNMSLKQNTPTLGVWPPSGVNKIVVADTNGNLNATLLADNTTIVISPPLNNASPLLTVGVIQRANVAAQAIGQGQLDFGGGASTGLNNIANLDINQNVGGSASFTSNNLTFTPSTNTQYPSKNSRPIRIFTCPYYGPGGVNFVRFYGTACQMNINLNYNGANNVAGACQTQYNVPSASALQWGNCALIDIVIPPGTISSATANWTLSWSQNGGNGTMSFVGRLTAVEL